MFTLTPPALAEPLPLEHFLERERRDHARVAFVQPLANGEIERWTWGRVAHEARTLAAHLSGLPRCSRIAIVARNDVHWIVADLATWLAGHVSVPLYPTLSPDAARHAIEHSEAELAFVGEVESPALVEAIARLPIDVVTFPRTAHAALRADVRPRTTTWHDLLARHAPLESTRARGANEVATIVYTSGTTGTPKGVMLSFGAIAWTASRGVARLGLGRRSRVLSYLPLAHVAERMFVEIGALATASTVYFNASLDTFGADLARARPTIFFSVPRLWEKLRARVLERMPQHELDRLLRVPLVATLVRRRILRALGLDACRLAIGGAAPMPPELLAWLGRIGLPIIEVYGMTENAAMSHSTRPDGHARGTVGWPLPGVETRIDPDTGGIELRTDGVMLGYFRDLAATREAMTIDGWLRTGDRGEIRADGALRITGRVKDLFKTSKGKYVAPAPIEAMLGQHPLVEQCLVTGAAIAQPVALVVLEPSTRSQVDDRDVRATIEAALRAHRDAVNARLEPHERITAIAFVREPWTIGNGGATPTLKLRRHAIEAMLRTTIADAAAAHDGFVWPTDPVD